MPIDYSKWDNLDSDVESDSDTDKASGSKHRKAPQMGTPKMSANETGSGVANGDRPVQLADGGDAAIEAASETNTTSEVPGSVLVVQGGRLAQLHAWLREDRSGVSNSMRFPESTFPAKMNLPSVSPGMSRHLLTLT